MKAKKIILAVVIISTSILSSALFLRYIGFESRFAYDAELKIALSDNDTAINNYINQYIQINIHHVDSSKLTLHPNFSKSKVYTATLMLRGIQGREKFYLFPSQWEENGGTADFIQTKWNKNELNQNIHEELNQLGIKVESCNLFLPKRIKANA
jgi:hypothetical protein